MKSYSYKYQTGGLSIKEVFLFLALTSIHFPYRTNLMISKSQCSLLYRIDAAEHFLLAPTAFFASAIVDRPVDCFESVTSLTESVILLFLWKSVLCFVTNFGLFRFLRRSQ